MDGLELSNFTQGNKEYSVGKQSENFKKKQ